MAGAYIKYCRQYAQQISAVALSVGCGVAMIPQTLGLSKVRKIWANQKNGEELELDSSTKNLIEKVLWKVKLRPEDEAVLDFFSCFGNDPVHKGSTNLRTGAIIGIPVTFSFRNANNISESSLRLGREDIDWTSPAGISLMNGLYLSDRAKAFAVAKEINYVASQQVYIDLGLKCLLGLLAYTTGFTLNSRFGMRNLLRTWARTGVYGLIGGVYFTLYLLFSDVYQCWNDNKVDYRTAKLGQAYAEGGVEFYDKTLQRNRAIRELLGGEGETMFTVYGNKKESLRFQHVQLTHRRENLMKYLKEYEREPDLQ